MRASLHVIGAAAVVLSAIAFAPGPAATCISFDFDGELAAVDRALATTQLPPNEAAAIQELRKTAVDLDRQAARMSQEADPINGRSRTTMRIVLGKLGLDPIVLSPEEADGTIARERGAFKGCRGMAAVQATTLHVIEAHVPKESSTDKIHLLQGAAVAVGDRPARSGRGCEPG